MSGSPSDVRYLQDLIASPAGVAVTVEAIAPCGPRYPRGHVSVVRLRGSEGWGERLILKRHRSAEAMAHELAALDCARRVPLRVPAVVASQSCPGSPLGDHVVLMTDMGERFLDEITPNEESDVLARVNEGIGRLHAATADASREVDAFAVLRPKGLAADLGVLTPFLQAHDRSAAGAEEAVRCVTRAVEAEAAGLADFRPCLVHGDLHVSNVLLDNAGEVGFVDWLESRWGDPALDLAYYFVRSLHLRFPDRAGALIRELVERHAEEGGDPGLRDRMRIHTLATLVRTLRLCAEWERLDLADKTASLLDALLSERRVW